MLRDYDIVDAARDPAIQDIVGFAANLCRAPIGLVSLVEQDRQWFAARVGLDAEETPRSQSFCAFAMLGDAVLIVPDATKDPHFADNPLVTGPPHIRFYAGAPLRSPEGAPLGSLCIIDSVPREGLSEEQLAGLTLLARQVMAQLELRRLRRLQAIREAEVETMLAAAEFVGKWDWDIAKDTVTADAAFARMYSVAPEEAAIGLPIAGFVAGIHPDDRARVEREIGQALAGDGAFRSEYRVRRGDGAVHWVKASGQVERDGAGKPVRCRAWLSTSPRARAPKPRWAKANRSGARWPTPFPSSPG